MARWLKSTHSIWLQRDCLQKPGRRAILAAVWLSRYIIRINCRYQSVDLKWVWKKKCREKQEAGTQSTGQQEQSLGGRLCGGCEVLSALWDWREGFWQRSLSESGSRQVSRLQCHYLIPPGLSHRRLLSLLILILNYYLILGSKEHWCITTRS